MYEKGMLSFGREPDSSMEEYTIVEGAFLPHSCDKWVIGGEKEVVALIEDLQNILKIFKESKP